MTNNITKSDNSRTYILVLLGTLTAFGPFVTDMYLPTLPSMMKYFNTTSSMVQLGLTTSMLGLAMGQLFFGPWSDRSGRKRPLVVAMWLFVISTVVCLFSQNIYQFLVCRFVQGLGGAGGIVISRSVATDKYGGHELAKMLAVIGAINGIAPVMAPVVGGLMTDSLGWKGIFTVLLIIGVILTMGCHGFKESLPKERRSASSWKEVFSNFGLVLRNREFLCFVMQLSMAQGILFGNIASSPFIIQEHYGFSALMYSIVFAINSVAIGVGSAMSVRFHQAASASLFSSMGMLAFATAECIALWTGCSFWVYESIMFPMLFIMGLTFTASTTLAMNSVREHAGTGSAVLGALGFVVGGLVSPIVGLGNMLHTTGIVFVVAAALSLMFMFLALGRRRARLYFQRHRSRH